VLDLFSAPELSGLIPASDFETVLQAKV
jgi:hypothetical protein